MTPNFPTLMQLGLCLSPMSLSRLQNCTLNISSVRNFLQGESSAWILVILPPRLEEIVRTQMYRMAGSGRGSQKRIYNLSYNYISFQLSGQAPSIPAARMP